MGRDRESSAEQAGLDGGVLVWASLDEKRLVRCHVARAENVFVCTHQRAFVIAAISTPAQWNESYRDRGPSDYAERH